MESQTDKKADIIKHIIDGTIKIDTIQEFQTILEIFPDEPSLHKSYSDLLMRKKSFNEASQAYKKTTDLFLNSGMVLQAISAKLMEWNLSKPTNQDAWSFYSSIRKSEAPATPFKTFFDKMTYPEMVAIFKSSEYIRLPAGKQIKKYGVTEDSLYFIVSGTIKETTYSPSYDGKELVKNLPVQLIENDFFGTIYPFEEKYISQSDIETATRTELIKLSKDRLIGLCKNYPDIEMRLNQLYRLRSDSNGDSTSHIVRKTTRYKIVLNASIDIYHDVSGMSPLVVNGSTNNISLGGICVYIDGKHWKEPPLHLLGKPAKTKISLPSESITISILGTIVWLKQLSQRGKIVDILGIQFKEMPPKLSGILLVIANIMEEKV